MNRKYAKIALMLFACITLVSCGKNGETEITESVKKAELNIHQSIAWKSQKLRIR